MYISVQISEIRATCKYTRILLLLLGTRKIVKRIKKENVGKNWVDKLLCEIEREIFDIFDVKCFFVFSLNVIRPKRSFYR